MSYPHKKKEPAFEDGITAINVTPLVDVSLVLVIIFMAAAPFAVIAGIKVLESQANVATGKVSTSDNVTVKLNVQNKITVNGQFVLPDSLIAAIVRALLKSKDRMVIISADDANKVGQVVSLLDAAKQAGAVKLALLKNDSSTPKGVTHGNRNRG